MRPLPEQVVALATEIRPLREDVVLLRGESTMLRAGVSRFSAR